MTHPKFLATLFLLASGGCMASAQADTARVTPTEPMRVLAPIVGNWAGAVTLEMEGQTSPGDASISCNYASGGAAILCRSEFHFGEQVQHETDMFGFDPATGTYHWFAVNSGGETHDHVATRLDEGGGEFRFAGQAEGNELVETIGVSFGAGQIGFDTTVDVGGQRAVHFAGKLKPAS